MGQPGSYLAPATPSSKNDLRDSTLCFHSECFRGWLGGPLVRLGRNTPPSPGPHDAFTICLNPFLPACLF